MMDFKPCPFCGAKVLGPCRADYYGAFYVIKHKENCFFRTIFGQHETTIRERSGKINVWNTRATDPLLKEMAEVIGKMKTGYLGSLRTKAENVLQKYCEQVGDTNAG